MGLMDKILKEHELSRPNRCGVSMAMAKLKKPQQDELQQALDNTDFTNVLIAKVLTDEGMKCSADSVGRHRKGTCGCAR